MIRPELLDLPPLHCSLDRALGDYYQDFVPALELVESGYHGGVSPDLVPWVAHAGQAPVESPIITAQYALANIGAVLRGDDSRTERARAQVERLVTTQESAGEWAGCWLMTHDNPKYTWLRAPWVSALASGNAISALHRGAEMFEEPRYRRAADAAYEALHAPRDRMRLCDDHGEELWYEEYPAEPPLRVLNGHVYALLGVVDHYRVTRDPVADERWRRAAATVRAHLEQFDLGYWSAYDLRWREPATLHYQKNIHVPQLRILGGLTGDQKFHAVADRWERYARSRMSRARLAVEVRLHRWRRR